MEKQKWDNFLSTATAVLLGVAIFGLLDRFVLSRFYGHLENLIEGEGE